MSRNDGFTLLEICFAVVIALLLLGLFVPSMESLFRERKLKATFEELDDLVQSAKDRAVKERRTFALVWEKGGISLLPEEPNESDEELEPKTFQFQDAEVQLQRTAALVKEPEMKWLFWRSGTCEPAVITYQGSAGTWTVAYDPFSVRANFLEEITQ